MKRLLLQLDSDRYPSSFDRIVAYDAGVDEVLSYGGVVPEDVTPLVHGALFTRGLPELRYTAIWIGGSSAAKEDALADAVKRAFFGHFRVSIMMDANGCNTTAAAAVVRLAGATNLKGTRAVILGGTGPVGIRAAVLLAREGASITISSRGLDRARAVCDQMRARFGIDVAAIEATDDAGIARALDGAQVCLAAGAAGVMLLPRRVWVGHPTLAVMADINTVPPLGIEGTEATDKGVEREGKRIFGALAIGSLKMKVHKACVASLFERNDAVLDVEAIYTVARAA